ncbi:hypothetical protein LguiA_017130 [Lonicera macranthoides]
MEDNNRRKEDYLHAVWFAAGMAMLMACFERAVIVSIFEQWRVWVFLVLNLLLLAILFTSTCSSTTVESKADDERGSNDLAELKIEVVEPSVLEVVEEDEDCSGRREERECGSGVEDEERKSKEELNERAEAFIAMFRQHLVSDAKGTSRRTRFHSMSRRKEYPNLVAPRVRVQR